jgi:hypothetical protein
MKYKGVVAVGLLALVLTAGCGKSCEVTCTDGFKKEWDFGNGCDDELVAELAKDHGGIDNCRAEEH